MTRAARTDRNGSRGWTVTEKVPQRRSGLTLHSLWEPHLACAPDRRRARSDRLTPDRASDTPHATAASARPWLVRAPLRRRLPLGER
jgi:hypothetical protein